MKNPILVTVAAFALLAVASAVPAHADSGEAATISMRPLREIATGAVVGSSTLVRTDDAVSMTLHTTNLTPGEAVTVWWVIVNPAGLLSVQHAAGHVIGADGTGDFGASLREGDLSGCAFGTEDCNGLLDARLARVVLVVKTHGELIPRVAAEQIGTFDGGCDVNECAEIQFSTHRP